MPESRAVAAFEEHRITFEHDGVRLSGWFIESPSARSLIVYYGGNGEGCRAHFRR
ncbi:MAG: hypothetical protein U5O39_00490 [Gammaproteobacteria bacterium]|nr:hypothetical protein [Gammaproteobacteria bacterium]